MIKGEQELNKIEKQLKVAVVRAKAYLKIENIRVRSKKYNELNKELNRGIFLASIVNKLESFSISELGIAPGASSGPDYEGWSSNILFDNNAEEKWRKYQADPFLYGAIYLIEECGELSKELERIESLAPEIRSDLIIKLTSDIADSFANIRLVFLTINLPKSAKQHAKEISRGDRADSLTQIIIDRLSHHREQSTQDIINYLGGCIGMGVIESISNDNIEWVDKKGQIQDTSIVNLGTRISRARKKIRNK